MLQRKGNNFSDVILKIYVHYIFKAITAYNQGGLAELEM
jgi:hypothetical protein